MVSIQIYRVYWIKKYPTISLNRSSRNDLHSPEKSESRSQDKENSTLSENSEELHESKNHEINSNSFGEEIGEFEELHNLSNIKILNRTQIDHKQKNQDIISKEEHSIVDDNFTIEKNAQF